MKDEDVLADISSIKNIMERSTKFISLSGLSGVMAGIYAIVGAAVAYQLIYGSIDNGNSSTIVAQLFALGLVVLVLSLLTGLWLTIRKARRKRQSVWNPSSRLLFINGALPLLTGGIWVLIFLAQGHYSVVAPGCLVFYGIALFAAGQHTYGDVKWLGVCEIILGLAAAAMPGFGLFFWAAGFGLLHIIYGTVMHFKYDL
jgi:hypothetical protein